MANPSVLTAHGFLESLPQQFDEFDLLYGYDETPGPLYEVPLYDLLPKLTQFLTPEEIADKYVALASGAKWDADNVNYLQGAYLNLFDDHTRVVSERIVGLPQKQQAVAIRFLFDGPHPSNKPLSATTRIKLQLIDRELLIKADEIYKELLAEELEH